ncbi:MAG: PAS domain S-box protein [Cyanobacteria bacterium SBLK]|nr:PAS domain S-box protein [Cyanobacteria bacterium SBLK]
MGLSEQASEDLDFTRELLMGIINTSLDGIAVVEAARNSDGEIVDFCWRMFNRAAIDLLNCSPQQAIGTSFQNPPPELPLFRVFTDRFSDCKRAIKTGQSVEIEVRIASSPLESSQKHLPEQWFYLAISKLEDSCVLTFREITLAKATEERLNLLERAIEASPSAIALADIRLPDKPIINLNSSFERVTGYLAEEIRGKSFPFAPEENREQPGVQELQRAIEEEREGRVILLDTRHKGKPLWNELAIAPIRNIRGELTHYIGVQSDISDRILAENRLRQTNERLNTLFASSAAILYSCKPPFSHQQCPEPVEGSPVTTSTSLGASRHPSPYHTWVSENVASMLGYEAKEFVSDRDFWLHRIHPLDCDRVLYELSHLFSKGCCACEYRFRHQDGTYRWLYDELRLLDKTLPVPEAIGYWLDITQRKRAELQLAASEVSLTRLLEKEKQYTQQLDRQNQQLQAEIRERIRAEERLQTSQQRLSFFFEQMPIAAIEWSSDRKIVAWNPGATAIFGYSAEEIIGQTPDCLVPHRTKARVEKIFADLLANRGGRYSINDNITKAGKNIACEWYNTPLIDENGTVIGIASIAADITERQQRELLESTQNTVLRMLAVGRSLADVLTTFVTQIDRLMPNLTTAIMFLSEDGTYLHSCISVQLPQEYLQEIDPFPVNANASCFGMTARSGKRVIVEDIDRSPEPSNILPVGYRACWCEPITADTGKILGVFVFYFSETRSPDPQEITVVESIGRLAALIIARKRSEVALQKSEERYERATRAAGVGVWECNLQNGDLYIDPTIKAVLGYRDEEFANDPEVWIEHMHPDDRESSKAAMTAYFAGENPEYIDEYRMLHKDGSSRWILCRGKALGDEQGNALQMVGTHTDISDRKRTEMALQQAKEEAEKANRAKSDFLASMSHELRTPLNAVLGFTQVLAQGDSLTSEQKEYLDIINRSGAHLLTLINDILSMSKIEAGRISLNEGRCDLHYLLESIRDMLTVKARAKNIDLIVEYTAGVPRYVQIDEGKLRQILINLVGNGIKFTDSGFVKLSVRSSQTPLAKRGKENGIINNQPTPQPSLGRGRNQQPIHFEVEDTGCGIAEADLEMLFNPFEQAKSQRSKIEGTGLGLPISREFARLMGGDITVKSDRDRGSTFAFTIPVRPVEESLVTLQSQTQNEIASMRESLSIILQNTEPYRILIVEDIPESYQLLLQLLQNVGFLPRLAENGSDAVQLWQIWQPHLILMDIRMPVMDGCEATRQIRDRENQRESPQLPTPIVAITASVFAEERAAIFAAGCDDIINKPIEENILWEKLAFYLQLPNINRPGQTDLLSLSTAIVPSLQQKQLSIMSLDWRERLERACLEIDYETMKDLIAQIPVAETEFAECLRQFIDDYRVDIILDWLQTDPIG